MAGKKTKAKKKAIRKTGGKAKAASTKRKAPIKGGKKIGAKKAASTRRKSPAKGKKIGKRIAKAKAA